MLHVHWLGCAGDVDSTMGRALVDNHRTIEPNKICPSPATADSGLDMTVAQVGQLDSLRSDPNNSRSERVNSPEVGYLNFGGLAAGSDTTRVLRPSRAAPADAVRPTRADVDLAALRHNLRVVQRLAGSATVLGVLKADGYGHGAKATARTLERAGIGGFAVALLEEAIELRDAGIRRPIVVMGGYYGTSHEEILAHALTPVVYDPSHLQGLSRVARLRGGNAKVGVHLNIDTGMSRLGVTLADLPGLLEHLRSHPALHVDGVMTHYACADVVGEEASQSLLEQDRLFRIALSMIKRAGIEPRIVHAANSAALLRDPSKNMGHVAQVCGVRPGIALFGVDPLGVAGVELHPTMRLRTEVVALRTISPGTGVGYGSTYRATRPTVIATVPVGYADGLPRGLSNPGGCGHMLIRGVRAPIVGALSMDLTTLDVTEVAGVQLRDEVVVLGEQRGLLGQGQITIAEVANRAGLIPWDVLTSISRRVPRFYRDF